jgi:DNA polymerase-3 subunit epsilon
VTIGKCLGACTEKENSEEYNERAEESLLYLKKIFDENLVIIEEGRSEDESAVILVENGHYLGYGYIDKRDVKLGVEEIKEAIDYKKSNPETNGIVRNYLNGEKRKIIRF